MSKDDSLTRHRPFVDALQRAIDAGDAHAFHVAFEGLRSGMHPDLMPELRRITATAQEALQRFCEETRLDDLAANEVPDARKRLAHVVKLTDEAAHRTLDLVERSGPLVDQASREAAVLLEAWSTHVPRAAGADSPWPGRAQAYLERTLRDTDEVRNHLSEMLLAQGYQDLTGQIIRGVISLVGELESVLAQLVRLSNGDEAGAAPATRASNAESLARGMGPSVPGVQGGANSLADQDDIDALLTKFAGGG